MVVVQSTAQKLPLLAYPSDLLCVVDVGLSILLDLSAAFDTIFHHRPLERLANIGVHGRDHRW